MPPKKNDNNPPASAKKSQEKKPAKPRVRQLKPKLKTPTVVKLKISPESLNQMKNVSPEVATVQKEVKLTRKQLTLEKKLDLANEVAAAQLGIKHNSLLEPTPEPLPPTKAKRGRKKKIVEPITCTEPYVAANVGTDSEDAFDVTPKKRQYTRKNPKSTEKKQLALNGTKGQNSLLIPRVKKTKQTKLTDAKTGITKTPVSKKIPPPEAENTQSKSRKRKLKPETGKPDVRESPTKDILQSPSILDHVDVHLPNRESTFTSNLSPRSDPMVEPCSIDSRKTSLTSECLSWTKDISSSSTTTCVTVCSTDIVRIDKKMPIIKLTPTTCHLKQTLNKIETSANTDSSSSSDSDSESSSSDNSPNRSLLRELTPDLGSRSLHLSTSSISPAKSRASYNSCQNSENNDKMSKISSALDKLASKLKHFDLEIINWIGYENEEFDVDTNNFKDNIFKMLKEEHEVITQCRHLKRILSDSLSEDDANEKSAESVPNEVETRESKNEEIVANDSVHDDSNVNTQRTPIKFTSERSEVEENNLTSERLKYAPYDQSGDDDDALSLFAESITGIESSRLNSSAASMCTAGDFEEYVPYPKDSSKWEPAKRISYPPPSNIEIQNDIKLKPVCEKQNADSTSIYKETEKYKYNPVPIVKSSQPVVNKSTVTSNKVPCLMSYIFKPLTGVKSFVFRGICFFNLISSCKNSNCRWPHVTPSFEDITAKLVRLSEELFIQEYMLMRNWPVLRRKYGMCFVHECARRDLSRILVEMGLDFVMKANEASRDDMILKVEVIECVLLHLNTVDLGVCEDILLFKHQGEMLCEIFMQAIANTQNFSRFKPVFINLTEFILVQERSFSLDVATQILERICILPCEPPLLRALLDIVRNTDRAILKNSMLGHFENQLSVASKGLHEQLLSLKREAALNRPVLQNLYEPSPRPAPEIEPVMANPLVSEREKRYTSPDTTNLDTMNKSTDEPVITRTIDFNRGQLFACTIQRSFSNSNSSNDSNEEFRPNLPKPNFKSWRDKSIFNSLIQRGRSPGHRNGTPRPPIKRHVHQHLNFGQSAPKFPRMSGPDFH